MGSSSSSNYATTQAFSINRISVNNQGSAAASALQVNSSAQASANYNTTGGNSHGKQQQSSRGTTAPKAVKPFIFNSYEGSVNKTKEPSATKATAYTKNSLA